MSHPGIIRIGSDAPPAEEARPATVLAGDPVTRTQHYFADPTGCFFAGVWESSPGTWRVRYTENEFVSLLAGRVVLTADDGTAQAFAAGEAFIIPAGFSGTWETVEPVRKLYAIYQAPAG